MGEHKHKRGTLIKDYKWHLKNAVERGQYTPEEVSLKKIQMSGKSKPSVPSCNFVSNQFNF